MDTKEVVKKFIKNMEEYNFKDAFGLLSENGQYIVIGTTKASRTYYGRSDLFENLLPLLSNFKETPSLIFQEPIVDGNRAVMLASGKGVGPTGPYDQPYYAFVTQIYGDEFIEIIEFMDTKMLETALFGGEN